MQIKSVKNKISKNIKLRLFLISQGSLNPKKLDFYVARGHTDRHTYTKVNTEDTLSGFQGFFPLTYHQRSVQQLHTRLTHT